MKYLIWMTDGVVGYHFMGPFDSEALATDWAKANCEGVRWGVRELDPPDR